MSVSLSSNIYPRMLHPAAHLSAVLVQRHIDHLEAVNGFLVWNVLPMWPIGTAIIQSLRVLRLKRIPEKRRRMREELDKLDVLVNVAQRAGRLTQNAIGDLDALSATTAGVVRDARCAKELALDYGTRAESAAGTNEDSQRALLLCSAASLFARRAQGLKTTVDWLGNIVLSHTDEETRAVAAFIGRLAASNHAILDGCPTLAHAPTQGLAILGSRDRIVPSEGACHTLIGHLNENLARRVSSADTDGSLHNLSTGKQVRRDKLLLVLHTSANCAGVLEEEMGDIVREQLTPLVAAAGLLPVDQQRGIAVLRLVRDHLNAEMDDLHNRQASFFEGWMYTLGKIVSLQEGVACDCQLFGSSVPFTRELRRSERRAYARRAVRGTL